MMQLWARAWTLSRGVAPPVATAGGWRIEVGLPSQARRFVFPACEPETLRGLAAGVDEPFVFIKCCVDEPTLQAALPDDWMVRQFGYLMVDEAPARVEPAPPGYRLHVEREPQIVRAQIRTVDTDEVAAQGQLILSDGLMVYDRITTEEAHRRQGLGRALMAGLKQAALADGPRQGALVATMMGRELYQAIGWRVISDYTTAASPGTEPFP